ncbi:MAG: Hsp20/alpha crystallin family protein [Balneolia bacterium]|nr:Hsp20/alpha crystallin family protein [Balneolia bacterium]
MSHFNFSEIEQRLNELGEDFSGFMDRVVSKTGKSGGFMPSLDVVKKDDAIILIIDLPGMEKSDVVISHRDQVLSVSGKRSTSYADGTEFLKKERSTGSFNRSFTLPENVNSADIKASMKQGVLEITVPLKGDAEESETIIIE